ADSALERSEGWNIVSDLASAPGAALGVQGARPTSNALLAAVKSPRRLMAHGRGATTGVRAVAEPLEFDMRTRSLVPNWSRARAGGPSISRRGTCVAASSLRPVA